MRPLIFCAAVLLAPLALPATVASACMTPSVPVYPGPPPAEGFSLPAGGGAAFIATTAPLGDIQTFYNTRLPSEGWAITPRFTSQHAGPQDAGSASARESDIPENVLEFTRNDDREHLSIIGAGDGYRIYLTCRD